MDSIKPLPNTNDVIRDASEKLLTVAHQRELDDKYFNKIDEYNDNLNKFEEKLYKKIYYDKIISSNINSKTLNKLNEVFEKFNTLNPTFIRNISSNFVNKNNFSCQTEETNESLLINKISLLEQSNEKLSKENSKYKNDIEIIRKENLDLKEENDKLNKQYVLLNKKIDEYENIQKECTNELSKIKNDNSNLDSKVQKLNKIIEELKQKNKNLEEKMKIDLENNKINLSFLNYYKQLNVSSNKKIKYSYLIRARMLNNVFEFLDSNDICNYIGTCKEIYNNFITEQNKQMKQFYLNIIKQKNEQIKKINVYDIKTEYLTKLPQLEQLIKLYSIDGKETGTTFKNAVDNALYFINKSVKLQLGLPESRQKQNKNNYSSSSNNNLNYASSYNNNTTTPNDSVVSSFFGGIKSMFGINEEQAAPNKSLNTSTNVINPKVQEYQSSLDTSSNNISVISGQIDFAKNDENLLNLLNNEDYGLKSNYVFDYNSSEDISKYLIKFIKSPIGTSKMTDFILSLVNNFCSLLYNGYLILKELRQLEIVTKSLNERFKFYFDLYKKDEKRIQTLLNERLNYTINKTNTKIRKYSIANNKADDNEGANLNIEESSYDELERKLELTTMNLNISNKKTQLYENKYEQIKNHFEQYKEMSKEESNDLKFKLDLVTQEKNELAKKINEFNTFFNGLLDEKPNINDKIDKS